MTALEILKELETAEQLLWETMRLSCHRGSVSHVRDATLRLALVRTFQASLGKAGADRPLLTVNLMGEPLHIGSDAFYLPIRRRVFRLDIAKRDERRYSS